MAVVLNIKVLSQELVNCYDYAYHVSLSSFKISSLYCSGIVKIPIVRKKISVLCNMYILCQVRLTSFVTYHYQLLSFVQFFYIFSLITAVFLVLVVQETPRRNVFSFRLVFFMLRCRKNKNQDSQQIKRIVASIQLICLQQQLHQNIMMNIGPWSIYDEEFGSQQVTKQKKKTREPVDRVPIKYQQPKKIEIKQEKLLEQALEKKDNIDKLIDLLLTLRIVKTQIREQQFRICHLIPELDYPEYQNAISKSKSWNIDSQQQQAPDLSQLTQKKSCILADLPQLPSNPPMQDSSRVFAKPLPHFHRNRWKKRQYLQIQLSYLKNKQHSIG